MQDKFEDTKSEFMCNTKNHNRKH